MDSRTDCGTLKYSRLLIKFCSFNDHTLTSPFNNVVRSHCRWDRGESALHTVPTLLQVSLPHLPRSNCHWDWVEQLCTLPQHSCKTLCPTCSNVITPVRLRWSSAGHCPSTLARRFAPRVPMSFSLRSRCTSARNCTRAPPPSHSACDPVVTTCDTPVLHHHTRSSVVVRVWWWITGLTSPWVVSEWTGTFPLPNYETQWSR